jgi:hypothetical protein
MLIALNSSMQLRRHSAIPKTSESEQNMFTELAMLDRGDEICCMSMSRPKDSRTSTEGSKATPDKHELIVKVCASSHQMPLSASIKAPASMANSPFSGSCESVNSRVDVR